MLSVPVRAPNTPRLVPNSGERAGMQWDRWHVIFRTDVADTEEDTAVPHQHQVYGQPPRSAMEVAIAVEPPDHYDGVNSG